MASCSQWGCKGPFFSPLASVELTSRPVSRSCPYLAKHWWPPSLQVTRLAVLKKNVLRHSTMYYEHDSALASICKRATCVRTTLTQIDDLIPEKLLHIHQFKSTTVIAVSILDSHTDESQALADVLCSTRRNRSKTILKVKRWSIE